MSEREFVEAEGAFWGKCLGSKIRCFIHRAAAGQTAEKPSEIIYQVAMQPTTMHTPLLPNERMARIAVTTDDSNIIVQILELLHN